MVMVSLPSPSNSGIKRDKGSVSLSSLASSRVISPVAEKGLVMEARR